ncbi:MAG TPA: hypothetical protein VF686_00240 [Brevundimonas sp.]
MPDGSPTPPADALPAPFEFRRPLQNWRDDGHGRRTAPDEVWAAVREDYLAGLSAYEVCERHGVRLTAMRNRAAREGWRRSDQPWAPRNRLDPEDEGVALEARIGGDLNKVELRELSYIASRRMMRAVLRGDAMDALRWRKVRDAMEAEEAEMERLGEQQDAIRDARLGYAEVDSVDSTDASDGVFRPEG